MMLLYLACKMTLVLEAQSIVAPAIRNQYYLAEVDTVDELNNHVDDVLRYESLEQILFIGRHDPAEAHQG